MRRTLVVASTLVLATAAAAPAVASAAPVPLVVSRSDHAAGYVRTHAAHSTESENVSATFTVPTAKCAGLPATGGNVLLFAAVDGSVAGSKVRLQGGVRISCASPTAAPKYQIYWAPAPRGPIVLGTTLPGHKIYVFVSSDDLQPVNVSDDTTGVLYAGSTGRYVTDHSGVECLVSAGTTISGAIAAQPNFGKVTFTSCIDFGAGDTRPVADPASARAGETTVQVQNNVRAVRSTTSPLAAGKTWAVSWVATGP